MSTIDQQFVEYIVKTLVNNPDKVVVDRTIDEKGVLLSLTVDSEDVGRVIGRRGITAQSIRTLLRALGTKNDARYNLKIVNTDDEGRTPRHEEAPKAVASETAPAAEATETAESVAPAEETSFDDDFNETEETDTSDLADRTRAELAEMDDLEI